MNMHSALASKCYMFAIIVIVINFLIYKKSNKVLWRLSRYSK